jgi:glycine cleavage system H protein
VKAASEVYAPVSGEIVEGNAALEDNPAMVNEDADETGWFFKLKLSDASQLDELMDEAAYAEFVKELD